LRLRVVGRVGPIEVRGAVTRATLRCLVTALRLAGSQSDMAIVVVSIATGRWLLPRRGGVTGAPDEIVEELATNQPDLHQRSLREGNEIHTCRTNCCEATVDHQAAQGGRGAL